MSTNRKTPSFVLVNCRCGRTLRVKLDQTGSEVRCWSCHEMVLVPIPRQEQQVAREFSAGLMSVIGGTNLPMLLIVATTLTAALIVPKVGIAVAGLLMVLGFSAYGDSIRRAGQGPDEVDLGWKKTLVPDSPFRALLCVMMAAGTVVPLWVLGSGERRSPHWSALGLVVAGFCWTVLPIAVYLNRAVEGEAALGWRQAGKMMIRHPVAVILALALVPAAYVLIEVTLDSFLYLTGNLPFFALDFMPMPGEPTMYDGVPHYHMLDYRNFPEITFLRGYRWGISHGYTFVGSIPASLSNRTRGGMSGLPLNLYSELYACLRAFITWLILLCLVSAIAIQARWLGSLPLIERKRPSR